MRVIHQLFPTRLSRCLTVFALGLILQAGIVFLAAPGKATGESVGRAARVPSLCADLSLDISTSVSSRANVAVGASYTPTYSLAPVKGVVISDTLVSGQLDPGQQYLDVVANQGHVVFREIGDDVGRLPIDSRRYTVTLDQLSPDLPLVITPRVVADTAALHRQVTTISGATRTPFVVTDTVVAQDGALTFDVSRDYESLATAGCVYSGVWRVAAPNFTVTHTTLTAEMVGGIYQSVNFGDLRTCENSISSFNCSIPRLTPGAPPAVISYTSRALESGRNDHVLTLRGGGESLTVTTTTTVLPRMIINVPIDIKPGGFRNPINPRSRGKIPVAILSADSFDAVAEVDQATLAFGPTGTENSLLFCNPEDSNRDGLTDLVCHFDTQVAAFQRGDAQGTITGLTFGGTPVLGSDSVSIVPKRKGLKRKRL